MSKVCVSGAAAAAVYVGREILTAVVCCFEQNLLSVNRVDEYLSKAHNNSRYYVTACGVVHLSSPMQRFLGKHGTPGRAFVQPTAASAVLTAINQWQPVWIPTLRIFFLLTGAYVPHVDLFRVDLQQHIPNPLE